MAKFRQIPNDDIGLILHNEMTGEFQERYVTVDEDGTCMPERYAYFAESIENFEVRNSDIWVCSFPRSGTTWTQEMLWLIANNLDFKAAKTDLKIRFPYFELCSIFNYDKIDKRTGETTPKFSADTIEFVKNQESPRFIKTHLPFSLLPKQIRDGSKTPKVIYVMRNPKDVCVSFYHFYKLMLGAKTSIDNFAKVFLANKVLYGSFWKHIFGYWEIRNSSNVLIVNYEDMKQDLTSVIGQMAKFLNKSVSDEQAEQLISHLSFESMKNNSAVNGDKFLKLRREKNMIPKEGAFIRTGIVGKYKEELSPETIKKFDAWIKRNVDGTTFMQEYSYEL